MLLEFMTQLILMKWFPPSFFEGGVRLVSLPVLISMFGATYRVFYGGFSTQKGSEVFGKTRSSPFEYFEFVNFSGNRSPPSGGIQISESFLFARSSKTPAKNLAED